MESNNAKFKYVYCYFCENMVGQFYRDLLSDNRVIYTHDDGVVSIDIDMTNPENQSAEWHADIYGEKIELRAMSGWDYTIYSDPRDAFGLGHGD